MDAIGIYAGSFDPFTNGHLDIVKRSLSICKTLYIVLGINSAKKTLFSEEERINLIKQTIDKEIDFLNGTHIKVFSYSGLIVDCARQTGANVLVRGVRSSADFEYEMNLATINKSLNSNVETVFIPTTPELSIVSSSMVKELAKFQANIDPFVPAHIATAVRNKMTNANQAPTKANPTYGIDVFDNEIVVSK